MQPTSKLEAVNTVLQGIGEAPVSSLSSGFVTASMASDYVDTASRELQERGWYFNTETSLRLTPDFEGNVALPANCLRVDSADIRRGAYVQRGLRLYDLQNHTFKIAKTVVVDIVVQLEFEDLPEAARRFISLRAKRLAQDDIMGDGNLHQLQTPDEAQAWARLEQLEGETGDFNIFDNYSLADWIRRDIN